MLDENTPPAALAVDHISALLAMLTIQMKRTQDRCNELLLDQNAHPDPDLWRDVLHLCARVEASSRQLEDTVHAAERLHARIAAQGAPLDQQGRLAAGRARPASFGMQFLTTGHQAAGPVTRVALHREHCA